MADDPSRPQRVEKLAGHVVRAPFGTGSRSARDAVYLDTPRGRFVLRRKDGPTYGDDALDAWVGKRVVCDGFLLSHTLIADDIRSEEA